MSVLKVVGVIAGLGVVAMIGGAFYLAYKKRKGQVVKDQVPTNPEPRPAKSEDESNLRPSPLGRIMATDDLPSELADFLDDNFDGYWPADEEVIDNLTEENVIVFAVESEPVGNYTSIRHELITARVLSVETSHVRARVLGPVAYAEHHGSHAGHGFRVGDLVEVPRSNILLAASQPEKPKQEYNGYGKAAQTFKPSEISKQTYQVRPGTPYDLNLPYRTDELEWSLDRDLVKLIHIGENGLIEQIMFSEDSMRGPVSVRLLDRDPKQGLVHVARWDFVIDA